METVGEAYRRLREALAFSGEAEAEALRILHVTQGIAPGSLPLHRNRPCVKEEEIGRIIQKRKTGMPLAYAVGSKPFYGYEFTVTSDVLIPRYDSECVAQAAIRLAEKNGYETALDLCCGSGALGIALLLESCVKTVCFSDISPAALEIAKENARRLLPEETYARCIFSCGDLLTPVEGIYDLNVCNPPYISPEDYAGLDGQVRDFEPPAALLAQRGGYEFYERLAREAGAYIRPGGALVLEIGDTQAERVQELLKNTGFVSIECGNDVAGRPRFLSAVRP
ncbi:MAG TPA: peptide chain release factor N(5)-glutamine methyltransferase [Clostridiales bacterium]|nr:peptide chain release factor N(5)-glutamine methyltransferase [Clostridiales bacterium]